MKYKHVITTVLLLLFSLLPLQSIFAQDVNIYGLPPVTSPPIFCGKVESLSCPTEMMTIYNQLGQECATSYADFYANPTTKHYWVEDPDITAQGKADERARQFLYWVITTNAVDNAPVLSSIWRYTSMIALVGVVLVAAIFGIGYIVSQRTNFDFKIRIWPTVIKVATMLLYVAFSSAIVFILIQFSEITMKFSYENLGGKELFNIYFTNPADTNLIGATEDSYKGFVGCRDLNLRVQEGIDTQIFMLKMTNVSYYVMGVMLLLRKILLWFLLFVSPFLALLMPFILIRNTGWIWIGVFFQWLFYGPLLTLFLGGMAQIWKAGIPFQFDFSRAANNINGYVYPTGINIVYGGPGQNSVAGRTIGAMNNGSYVDTFAEYVITLIMLWAVTFFPWWLLRIFRDYCCDGIYAMKNILLAMYDNQRNPPGKGPSPSAPPARPGMKLQEDIPTKTDIRVALGSMDQIRKSMTQDLTKNLSLSATRITDIARVETNKQLQSTVNQNLTYLANPVKATRPAERQQYMNLRSELFARAIKNDAMAQTILQSTSTSATEKTRIRQEILKSIPQLISITQITTTETHVPQEQVTKITNSYVKSIANNTQAVQAISQATSTPTQKVQNILNTYNSYSNQSASKIVTNIAKETNTTNNTVKEVLREAGRMSSQARIVNTMATVQKLDRTQISKVLTSIRSSVTREESTLQTISGGSSVPPPQVQQIVTNVFNEAAENEEIINNITPPGQPPVVVKAVLKAYVKNMEQPAPRIIEKIATETNTSKAIVSNILSNTTKLIQNTKTVQSTAEKTNTSAHDVQTVIEKAVEVAVSATIEKPALESVTRSVTKAPPMTGQTIKNVINEFANNQTTVNQVAQKTQLQQSQVQNIVQSFAKNLNTSSTEIVKNVAKETNTTHTQVTNVMSEVAQTVVSNSSSQSQIAQASHVTNTTVQKIASTVGSAVQVSAQAQAPTIQKITSQTSSTEEIIQRVITSFATDTELTTQIAQETQVEQSTVQRVIQSFSSHLNESASQMITSVAAETQTTTQNVQNILQKTADAVSNSSTYQERLTQITNAPAQAIKNIAHTVTQFVAPQDTTPIEETIITTTSQAESLTQEQVTQTISHLATNTSLVEQVAEQTKIPAETVKNVYTSYASHLTEAPSILVKSVAQETNITQEQVQNIMQETSKQVVNAPSMVTSMAQTEQISENNIQQIAQALPQSVQSTSTTSTQSLVEQVAQNTNITKDESQKIIHNLISTAIQNEEFIQTLAQKTKLKAQQVTNIMNTYANNINESSEKIVKMINESSGIPKASVQNVLIVLTEGVLESDQIVGKVAEEEGIESQQVSDVMEKQMEVASEPEKHIEKTISIPQSISLEDYEEVKDMWTKHYEEGEVPVTENIQSRKDWVDQEIVFITNTLNKILSPDERLQQEGLDELGYLLPIFLINNLKGEELIVYLKAKLEAAKLIQKILDREEKLKSKIEEEKEEDEEMLVDIKTTKEEPKAQEMSYDEDEEAKAPKSIEDRVKAVQEKLSAVENTEESAPTGDPQIDDLRSKLQEKADK